VPERQKNEQLVPNRVAVLARCSRWPPVHSSLEVELLDREGDQLGDPQRVPERQEDEQLVPNRVAVLAAALQRPLGATRAAFRVSLHPSLMALAPGCAEILLMCQILSFAHRPTLRTSGGFLF
jgi:hypothetical protein